MLKLRQAANPNFGFLSVNHEFYPYYCFLKKNYETIQSWLDLSSDSKLKDIPSDKPKEENKEVHNGAPPEDLKKIIDKLASFVNRHGKSFEDQVREKEENNANFAFLKEGNQYYKYYLSQLEQHVKEDKGIVTLVDYDDTEDNIADSKMDNDSRKRELEDPDEQKKKLRLKKAKLYMQMIQEQ